MIHVAAPGPEPAGRGLRSAHGPLAALGILGLALLALGLHARHYLPFLCDDALISLRYAKRLVEGQGLTWNAGERVEGYSNLLWVLGAAALGALGVDLIDGVRLLGFLGMGASLVALLRAGAPAAPREAVPVLLGVLFLPFSGPFAVWSIGGMEQPFVAAFLGWAVVLSYPLLDRPRVPFTATLPPGLCFGLLCLTRPDGPVFVAGAVATVLLVGRARREALRRAAGLAALPLLFWLLQLAFRLSYYGEWVPNTALVKFDPSARHALDGLGYVAGGALSLLPLIAAAAASAVLSFRLDFEKPRTILLGVLVLSWTAYLVVIGGDIFPAWRHFVPLVLLLGLMTMVGARWVGRVARGRTYVTATAAGAGLLGIFLLVQTRDPANTYAVSERWEWDGQVIGRLFEQAFGAQQPLLAVDAAGALPYWSGLPSLDMLGLNDFYLPRHPPRDQKRIGIGHDLGDGAYVLRRAPDLVVFGIATGGEEGFFRSAREMQEDPRFARDYTLVVFEGADPHTARAKVWVRRRSERIGIRRAGAQLLVPGFLFNGNPGSVARLGSTGALGLAVSAAHPGLLDTLELTGGRWRIEALPPGAPLRVRVLPRDPPSAAAVLDAPLPAILELPAAGTMRIEVMPVGEGIVLLERLSLTPLPPA